MDKGILVSVLVLTYNASKTVIETLESIYRQDYENIELVIADDASTDDTIEVVNSWYNDHSERFSGYVVNVQPKNGGVPANLNAGIRKSNGKYIKIIASDDLLSEDCISTNVEICEKNGYRHLITWLKKFSDGPNGRTFEKVQPDLDFFSSSAQEQYNTLLKGNIVYGCLFFAEKAFIEEMGMYDERYTLIEDYPMWIKMTRQGNKFNFHNAVTVFYRISDSSLCNFVGTKAVNERYIKSYDMFVKNEIIPPLLKKLSIYPLLRHWRNIFYHWLLIALGNDRQKRSVRVTEYFFMRKYLSRFRQNKK